MKTLFALIIAFVGYPQPALRAAQQVVAPAKDLNTLIAGVDKTYASMKDFTARFVQTSARLVNYSQHDEGFVYLTRGKKMRVEYKQPEEKLFVSNGTTLYTYVPANRQVTKVSVKNSTVEQFPIMFLLGRSGLRNEFDIITELTGRKTLFEGDRVLRLSPKRKNQEIEYIEIEVNPLTSLIVRMSIFNSDESSTDFSFFDVEINSNISASKFEFTPPQGIRVIQGVGFE